MTYYHATGKQVLGDGGRQHIADAADPETAALIVDALNHCNNSDTKRHDTFDLPLGDIPVQQQMHATRREGDEYACICGKRWDVAEGEEHP